MSARNEIRFTIGQFAIFTLVIAVVLVGVMDRHTLSIMGQGGAIVLLVGLIFFGVIGIIEGYMGTLCPSCGDGKMKRVAISTFGYRYFRCDHCRARWKKGPFRLWESAETEEDAPRFARKVVEDPWTLPPGMTDDDEVVWSKTHTNLLMSKHRRNPDAPRQEKLPPVE